MNELIRADNLPIGIADESIIAELVRFAAAAVDSYSPESERAWRQDVKSFSAYCGRVGAAVMPALPATVAAYICAESEASRAVATIRRRVASIAAVHRGAKLEDPTKDRDVRLALKAVARTRGTDQRQAEPLTEGHTRTIEGFVRGESGGKLRPKDARDLAMVLTARDLMARAGELTGTPDVRGSGIRREGIKFDADGTTVRFRRFKTDTESQPLLIGEDTAEALKTWTDYLESKGIKSGPVFVSLTKGGNPTGAPLTAGDVNRIVKSLAKRAGLNAEPGAGFSGHSMRVGGANDLIRGRVSATAIKLQAGWKTETMLIRYGKRAAAKNSELADYYARRHKQAHNRDR
jgi:hypothetical protein